LSYTPAKGKGKIKNAARRVKVCFEIILRRRQKRDKAAFKLREQEELWPN